LQQFDSATSLDNSAPARPVPAPVAMAPIRAVSSADSGSGILQLTPLPPRTTVFIDSRPVIQPGADIHVSAGWHELGVSAPGYLLFTDSVRIEAGKVLRVTPVLSATNTPAPAPGSAAEFRRRVLARLDCENPGPANRFGALCYDSRPQPLTATRVPVPAGVDGVPSDVILVVKVSRQGQTLAVRTRAPSNDPRFTQAVENFAQAMRWTPAMREGQPVPGWTMARFSPDTP